MIHDDFFETVDDHMTFNWSIMVSFIEPRRRPSTVVSKMKYILQYNLHQRLQPPLDDIQYDFSPPPLDNLPDATSILDVPLALKEGIANENEAREKVTTSSSPPTRPTQTSTRVKTPTTRFLNSMFQKDLEFHDFSKKQCTPQACAFTSIHLDLPSTLTCYEALHQDGFRIQDDLIDPIVFFANIDGDTLHCGQAKRADDKEKFKKA